MKPFRLFDEATFARLSQLSKSTDATPRLSPVQRQELAALLKESATTSDTSELVALGDRVRLVAPQDADDWYEFELVLPSDADIDADRISLFTPVGLAVIGRKCGDSVAWEVPAGTREMTIASVAKPVLTGG
jgi:transcription elongation GreA/GreB family factor